MGAEQSAPLPQTTEQARAHSAAPQRQPSLLTRMMDPRTVNPYATNLPHTQADNPGSHSRSSSVNAAPSASASHVSLSLELLGDESHDADAPSREEGEEERRVVEGAMSRIAPPALAALLAGDTDGGQANVF